MLCVRMLTFIVLIADGSLTNCKISHRVKTKQGQKTGVTIKVVKSVTTTITIMTMITTTATNQVETVQPNIIMSYIAEEKNAPPAKILRATDDNPVQVYEGGAQRSTEGQSSPSIKSDIRARISKKICHQKLEPGYCQSGIRYGFDQRSGRCVHFIYQGCRGNDNRFISIDDCKQECEDDSSKEPDDPCEWSWPFLNRLVEKLGDQLKENKKKKSRRKKSDKSKKKSSSTTAAADDDDEDDDSDDIDSQSSADNDTSVELLLAAKEKKRLSSQLSSTTPFELDEPTTTMTLFPSTAMTTSTKIIEINPQRCRNTIDSGPCRDNEIVYGYDLVLRRCVQFVYGGCEGNSNRFETRDECRRFCQKPGRKVKVKQPSNNNNNNNNARRKRSTIRTTSKPERHQRRFKRETKSRKSKTKTDEQERNKSQDEKWNELLNRFYKRMKDNDKESKINNNKDSKGGSNKKSDSSKEIDAEVDEFLYNNTGKNETILNLIRERDKLRHQDNEKNLNNNKKGARKLVENKLLNEDSSDDDGSEDDSSNKSTGEKDDDDVEDDDDDDDEESEDQDGDNDNSNDKSKKKIRPAANKNKHLNKKKKSARCYQKIDPGGCDPGVRFAYDFMSASCVKFTYEGCYGNDNQFLSVEQCSTTCSKPKRKKKDS